MPVLAEVEGFGPPRFITPVTREENEERFSLSLDLLRGVAADERGAP